MIVQRAPDRITAWSVAFFEGGAYRFARWVPGRFKHCLAFGYSEPARTWVVFDVAFADTRIYVFPDGAWGMSALADVLAGATVVRVPSRDHVTGPRARACLGFYCVPAVAHLVGCRCGALTPTGLFNALVAEGAEVTHDGHQLSTIRPARAA